MSQDETVNVSTENSDGKTGNVSPDNSGGNNAANKPVERKYTEAQFNEALEKRLLRDRIERKVAKKAAAEQSPSTKTSSDADSDLRGSLNKVQSDYKKLTERLEKTRQSSLKNMIEKKLASEYNVVDPELISDRFMTKKLVSYDEDDNIVVDEAFESLDDMIKLELEKRPYLVKSTAKGGAGTKGPGGLKNPSNPNVANMTSEEFEAFKQQKYGINTPKHGHGNTKWLTGE